MLHIELRDHPYHGTTIEIQPDEERLIPRLRDMVDCHFQIENPAVTFSKIRDAGGFDGIPEDIVNGEAEKIDELCNAWIFDDNETIGVPEANIMQVLTRLMELYIAARREIKDMYCEDIFFCPDEDDEKSFFDEDDS